MADAESTLYRRLGGYDIIAKVVDDMFTALREDPAFARFGAGRSIDSHNRARQLLVDQICQLSGGPCIYIGREMKTSHAGLQISESEWVANMQHASAALLKNDVPESERAEFLSLFERYRGDIVESTGPTVAT